MPKNCTTALGSQVAAQAIPALDVPTGGAFLGVAAVSPSFAFAAGGPGSSFCVGEAMPLCSHNSWGLVFHFKSPLPIQV
jgi:hypothetical protein